MRAQSPPPTRSKRLYLAIDRARVSTFRFMLEARDNLALFTVVDPWQAVIQVRYSPDQTRELERFLEDVRDIVPWRLVYPEKEST